MDAIQFVYWLQGFLEMSDVDKLNTKQTQILKDHIALVLKKVTPIYEKSTYPDTPKMPYIPRPIDEKWIDTKVSCAESVPQFSFANEYDRVAHDIKLCSNQTVASC